MASSLQSFEPHAMPMEASAPRRPAFNNHESPRWEMRIRFGQVIVLWAVLAGMMVMVFMFGFHAGREQGLSRALDQSDAEAVRLPIARPLPDGDAGEFADASAISDEEVVALAGAGLAGKDAAEPEFDFSRSEKVASAEPGDDKAVSAGLSGKPALEMFKHEEDSGSEVLNDAATSSLSKVEEDKQKQQLIKEAKALADALSAEKKAAEKAAALKTAKTEKAAALELSQLSPPLKIAEPTREEGKIEPLKAETDAAVGKKKQKAHKIKVESAGAELSPGWYVQAAATRTQADAVGLVAKFNSSGLNGVLEQAKVRNKEYYRVLVGPYGDKEQALAARSRVKSAGVTGGEPFLKHVK